MWESEILTSHGGISIRRIFAYALTAFAAAFLWILLVSPLAHAADATWQGSTIVYNGNTYEKKTADSNTRPTMKSGTTYYRYIQPTMSGGTINVIYFDSGATASSATKAKFYSYEVDSGAHYVKTLENTTIGITPKTSPSGASLLTDAVWDGNSIKYDNKPFTGEGDGPRIADGVNDPRLPKGTQYYQYVEPIGMDGKGKVDIIYFPAGSVVTAAKHASYVYYSVDGNLNFGKASAVKTISINGSATTDPTASSSSETTCAVDEIGWFVCPVSNFLATGMDNAFKILEGFLLVKPLTGDTGSSMYKAWSYSLTLANIAFVIAFLIIIFSQLTNMGVPNYGIKKLLPRLIIAAVLVNISFYICSMAIDISNILGDSVQKVLIMIRESLTAPNTNKLNSWASLTGFILAGGTATAAAGVGISATIIATGASAGAAIILLLPILLGLIVAVLIALVVLAARQALITVLVIVAPLAFVAYLLPNTEKWFERWRETLTTLLVFFPIFSLIFGGSQLAGFLIMQNTDQITVVLLGMFVQVAPLVITPMLIKFSGNIVSRIANMVNNPSKGIIDRTRNWSKQQAEVLAKRNMARTDPVRRRQVFRRFALGMDRLDRIREASKNMYGAQADANWANSRDFSDIDQGTRQAQDRKTVGESLSEARYTNSKATPGAAQNLDVQVRTAKLDIENANATTERNWEANHDPYLAEQRLRLRVTNDSITAAKSTHDAAFEEFKAGRSDAYDTSANVAQMLYQSRLDTQRIALNAMRNSFAKQVQSEKLTQAELNNTQRIDGRLLRDYAGGVHIKGAERALAQALTEQHKARAESISNANAIIEHLNLSSEETLDITKNISVKGVIVTDDILEAAAKRVASSGTNIQINEMLKSINLSPTGDPNLRLTVVEALKGNSNRTKTLGLGILDQITQGIPGGIDQRTLDEWTKGMLDAGKLSAAQMVKEDKDSLALIFESIKRIPRTPAFDITLRRLKKEIKDLNKTDQLRTAAGERKSVINKINKYIGIDGTEDSEDSDKDES